MPTMDRDERAVKRRMLLLALDLRPKDVRRQIPLPNEVTMSFVLSGARDLRPDEIGRATRLFSKRARRLFGE